MEYEAFFDTHENRTLLAICARKLISNVGIGGIIWGIVNIGWGIYWLEFGLLNLGLLILGVMMLSVGVRALQSPSLQVLFLETVVTVLLLAWNVFATVWNLTVVGEAEFIEPVFSLFVAVFFIQNYRKLRYLKERIDSIRPEEVKATKAVCKAMVKKKLKNEPNVVRTIDQKCRAQLMDDKAFFIRRDLARAFVVPRKDVPRFIPKPDAKRLKLVISHPLGILKYGFDRKNSDKLKSWLAASAEEPEPSEVIEVLEDIPESA